MYVRLEYCILNDVGKRKDRSIFQLALTSITTINMMSPPFLPYVGAAPATTCMYTWHTPRARHLAIIKLNNQINLMHFQSYKHCTVKMTRTASTQRFLACFHLPYPEYASSQTVAPERDGAPIV